MPEIKFEPEDYDPDVPVEDSPHWLHLSTPMYLAKVNRTKLSNVSKMYSRSGLWQRGLTDQATMLLHHGLDREFNYWEPDDPRIEKAKEFGTSRNEWLPKAVAMKAWIFYTEETLKLACLRKLAFKTGLGKEPCAPDANTALAVLTMLTYIVPMFQTELTYVSSINPEPAYPVTLNKPRTYIKDDKTLVINNQEYPLPDVVQLKNDLLENGYPEYLKIKKDNIDPKTGQELINKQFIPIPIPGRNGQVIDFDTGALMLSKTRDYDVSKPVSESFYEEYRKYRKMFPLKWFTRMFSLRKGKYLKNLIRNERLRLTYMAVEKEDDFEYPHYKDIETPKLGY